MSLSRFIEDFEKTTRFVIPDEQVAGVEQLVKDYIHKLLETVGEIDGRFTTSHVLPAGSFYEKTRVSRVPDEFDLMTRLTQLTNDIIFIPGCNGYSRIKVVQNKDRWKEFCEDDFLLPENYIEVVGKEQVGNRIMDRFYKLVLEAVNSGIKTFSSDYGTVELERMEGSTRGGIELNLNYKYDACDLPRDVFNSTMTSCTISVDLVPVIQLNDVTDIGKFVKSYPSEFDDIVKSYGCFLVPKSCAAQEPDHQCWRFTFSRPEMAMMFEMDESHRKCYRVLKSIYIPTKKYVHTQGHLCSYVLKTAMLHHYKDCRRKKSAPIDRCIIEVLEYLIARCKDFSMPCFFDNDLNIFKVLTVPTDKQGRQSGDIKYISDKRDGVRFVALICRKVCKTPIVKVRWGRFLSKLVDLVRGILLVVENTELDNYDFDKFAGWFGTMNKYVNEFFDVPDGETDKEFLYKLHIRDKTDEEILIGVSALIETIEEKMFKALPIHHDKVKWLFDHIYRNELIPVETTPPGWFIVNLSLTPGYTETSWRTYLRDPKNYLQTKANCSLDFFNHSASDIETEHDINFVATETIRPGDELHLKFGSVTGAYDRQRKPTVVGKLKLERYLNKDNATDPNKPILIDLNKRTSTGLIKKKTEEDEGGDSAKERDLYEEEEATEKPQCSPQ